MPSLPLPMLTLPYDGKSRALTPDESEVLAKELRDELFGIKALLDYFTTKGTADLGVVHTVFSTGEHRRDRLCKMLGIEMDSSKERDDRYARLREANGRIRELERLVGEGLTPEACSQYLKNLCARLEFWWDVHGFGYIRDMHFTKWGGMQVEFSCSLSGDFRLRAEDKPVSARDAHAAWLAELAERGFLVENNGDRRDANLLDCDQNRTALQKLFSGAFADAKISKTENHFSKNVATLRSVTVYFHDLAEVHALPLPEAESKGVVSQ